MGSVVDNQDEFTVLVTGFAPFREQYPRNPSWEIASRLPAYLPPSPSKDQSSSTTRLPEVRIVVHPEPIRVNYKVVRDLVPRLWDEEQEKRKKKNGGKGYDAVIHIGMAGPRSIYQIERRGHRDGYKSKDVDGKMLGDQDEEGNHVEGWYWEGMPEELQTELDIEDILKRWREHSPKDAQLRISEDAGHFLCDFIYYSSLSHLYAHHPGKPRKVLFMHVPADANEQTIPRGVEMALGLIRSIAESEVAASEEGEEGTKKKDENLHI
ncbi:pyroglutamyl peptidase domain-containing protein [Sarocladium implicatum]|nr:pyroglutamyl peptidase domain-containing protein [Sarocladium implicatum]